MEAILVIEAFQFSIQQYIGLGRMLQVPLSRLAELPQGQPDEGGRVDYKEQEIVLYACEGGYRHEHRDYDEDHTDSLESPDARQLLLHVVQVDVDVHNLL